MRYAQYQRGHKLHLVYEPGEGKSEQDIVRVGYYSLPLCGKINGNGYRMTINVPLANACQNCQRVYHARNRDNVHIVGV